MCLGQRSNVTECPGYGCLADAALEVDGGDCLHSLPPRRFANSIRDSTSLATPVEVPKLECLCCAFSMESGSEKCNRHNARWQAVLPTD